ncbi:MAG: cupin domain-containing protein [Polyangiaceae bacterium]
MGNDVWLRELSETLEWECPETRVRAFRGSRLDLENGSTHFLFCYAGQATLRRELGSYPMAEGMFASVPGACSIDGTMANASGLVVSHLGYAGMFALGGPIEATGRLRYIDGCTDSLLLSPPVLGDPCFNHLHIPKGTQQTKHVHPSVRVGLVVRGEGMCLTPNAEWPLRPGLAFMLPPNVLHAFWTQGSSLDVVVYHPDSDTGPTDADHPMRNRTIIPT